MATVANLKDRPDLRVALDSADGEDDVGIERDRDIQRRMDAQPATDDHVVRARLRCAGGDGRRVMLRDIFVPLVARVAEGHHAGLALQHRAQHEEDERRCRDGETEPPLAPPQPIGDAEQVLAEGAQSAVQCRRHLPQVLDALGGCLRLAARCAQTLVERLALRVFSEAAASASAFASTAACPSPRTASSVASARVPRAASTACVSAAVSRASASARLVLVRERLTD